MADLQCYKNVPSNLITNVILANQRFECRYSNFRDVVASFPPFSRPAARALRRARWHAKEVLDVNALYESIPSLLLQTIPYPSPPPPLRVMLYTYTCGVCRNFAFLEIYAII